MGTAEESELRLGEGSMQRHKSMITFIDLLMILALLLIVAGMMAPHLARKSAKSASTTTANPAPVSRPLR